MLIKHIQWCLKVKVYYQCNCTTILIKHFYKNFYKTKTDEKKTIFRVKYFQYT